MPDEGVAMAFVKWVGQVLFVGAAMGAVAVVLILLAEGASAAGGVLGLIALMFGVGWLLRER